MRSKLSKPIAKALAVWRDERGITGLETAIVLIAFVVVSSVFAFSALSTGLFSSDQAKETMQSGLKQAQGTLEVRGSVIANTATTTVTGEGFGTGTGTTTAFDLANGPVIPGSATISVDGTAQTEGTDYSISYDTDPSVVTFTSAPANNATTTADYTHYSVNSVVLQLANSAGGKAVDLTPGTTILSYRDENNLGSAITTYGLSFLGSADGDNLLEANETAQVTLSVDTGQSYIDNALYQGKEFTVQVKPQQGAVVNVTRSVSESISSVMNLD